MSKKREIDQLISEAVLQGLKFEYLPSGHWQAYNPDNRKRIQIASTPRSNRGVTNARVRLTRIGFEPKRPPKKKKTKGNRKMALKIVATDSEETTMPKLGEMATIKAALPTSEVAENIPMAAYILWDALHLRMKAKQDPIRYDDRQKTLGDIPGRVWEGHRSRFMENIWPGISRNDKNRLGQYLSGSKNMVALVRGRGTTESVWWISDEFTEVSLNKARYTSANWWYEDNTQISSAGKRYEKKKGKFAALTPDEQGYYRCDQCNFATKSLASFQPHVGKLANKSHPNDGVFTCNFCSDILPTAEQLGAHHTRKHKDSGWQYCKVCPGYYQGDPYKHKSDHVAQQSMEKLTVTSPPWQESEAFEGFDEEKPKKGSVEAPEKVTPVAVANETDLVVAENALRTILDEVGKLRSENDELRAQNMRLKEKNGELRAVLEPLQKFFNK